LVFHSSTIAMMHGPINIRWWRGFIFFSLYFISRNWLHAQHFCSRIREILTQSRNSLHFMGSEISLPYY